MDENTEKETFLANRILLAGFTAVVSALLWVAVFEITNLGELLGPFSIKPIIGLAGITVIFTDRAYVKYKKNNEQQNT